MHQFLINNVIKRLEYLENNKPLNSIIEKILPELGDNPKIYTQRELNVCIKNPLMQKRIVRI